jgi:hypothetical protein
MTGGDRSAGWCKTGQTDRISVRMSECQRSLKTKGAMSPG